MSRSEMGSYFLEAEYDYYLKEDCIYFNWWENDVDGMEYCWASHFEGTLDISLSLVMWI